MKLQIWSGKLYVVYFTCVKQNEQFNESFGFWAWFLFMEK